MENIQAQDIKSTEEIEMDFSNYGIPSNHEQSNIYIKEELRVNINNLEKKDSKKSMQNNS